MNLGNRIMIMGSSGSGKSTMASRLSEITGLPAVHLDRLFWNPGWVPTEKDIMDERVRRAADEARWIIDGNYSRTRGYRLERADSVIYLDFGRLTCIARALKRWIKNYGRTRYDLGEGCPEKIDMEFLSYIWGYPARSRTATIDSLAGVRPPARVYLLKGNRAVSRFLSEATESYNK